MPYFAALHRVHGLKVRGGTSLRAVMASETLNAAGKAPLWIAPIPRAKLDAALTLQRAGWMGSERQFRALMDT